MFNEDIVLEEIDLVAEHNSEQAKYRKSRKSKRLEKVKRRGPCDKCFRGVSFKFAKKLLHKQQRLF